MSITAFLFPGQGSQAVGMGSDLYEAFDFVKEIFHLAEELTGIDLTRLCFEGPMKDLTATVNLQPAVTAVNLACLAAVAKEGIAPDFAAGHSLGEFSALHAAGVISQSDALRLVFKRAQLMHRESTRHKGAMHAIIGMPIEAVQRIVTAAQQEGTVSVANHNAESQIVVTGTPEAVQRVAEQASSEGARAIPLKVSGAWHSPLMREAQSEFAAFLESASFRKPAIPVVFNTTADTCGDADEIRRMMHRQLCSPVRWYESVGRLVEEKVDTFVEIGPGKVLSGLVKKTLPPDYPCRMFNVNNLKTLEHFVKHAS